jgi:hypothetical protein
MSTSGLFTPAHCNMFVRERPAIPLHNNSSESDIREYVKKRKISGATRSDLLRRCRDTFTSLQKTCRKLGVGSWVCLSDRVSGVNALPWLPDLVQQRSVPKTPMPENKTVICNPFCQKSRPGFLISYKNDC